MLTEKDKKAMARFQQLNSLVSNVLEEIKREYEKLEKGGETFTINNQTISLRELAILLGKAISYESRRSVVDRLSRSKMNFEEEYAESNAVRKEFLEAVPGMEIPEM